MLNKIFSMMLLTVVTVIGFFMYKEQDLGTLRVSFASFNHEANLLAVMIAALILLFAMLLFKFLLGYLINIFSWFGSKRHLRLAEKATRLMMQGMTELAEGRYTDAEKHLLTEIKHNDNAVLAYLGAARAAQQQNAQQRRDKYLLQAHELASDADAAIMLTKAELQLANKQNELALATLSMLAADSPDNMLVQRLLATVYHRLADWDNLQLLLPELKQTGALPTDEISDLETQVWKGLLHEASKQHDGRSLARLWSVIPRPNRLDPDMVMVYAQLLLETGDDAEAEQVLRDCLNDGWNDDIISLYTSIDVVADNKQLEAAQAWLGQHQHDVHLLLALGNMCAGRTLWGKARSYYEASISVRPTPLNCLRLAQLLEQHMNESELAQTYYRQGLRLIDAELDSSSATPLIEHKPLDEPVSEAEVLRD